MKLIITGFKNKEEVEAFCSWYSGAGEQDASYWFDARRCEGESIREYMNCKGYKQKDKDTFEMDVSEE